MFDRCNGCRDVGGAVERLGGGITTVDIAPGRWSWPVPRGDAPELPVGAEAVCGSLTDAGIGGGGVLRIVPEVEPFRDLPGAQVDQVEAILKHKQSQVGAAEGSPGDGAGHAPQLLPAGSWPRPKRVAP